MVDLEVRTTDGDKSSCDWAIRAYMNRLLASNQWRALPERYIGVVATRPLPC